MKKTHENTGSQAMWRRALALLVALSLVLIPVKFPGAAKAVGQTVTETAPGSYFSDDFSDDSLLQGVTYKWNYAGTGNHSIAGGKLQLGLKDTSGHNAVYLSATTGEGESLQDVSADWTDYTVTTVLDRSHVPGASHMGGVLGRVSKDADGKYSYYLIMVQGNLPDKAAETDKLSVKLFKVVGANSVTQYVPSGEIAVMIGTAVKAGFAKSTANEIKVTFTGDKIQCWVDGELAIDYKDSAPITAGTVGLYQQTGWQLDVDSFKIDFADGSNSVCDDFSDTRFETGVTTKWDGSQVVENSTTVDYKWNTNYPGKVTGTVENGTFTLNALANRAYFWLSAEKDDPENVGSKIDATAAWTDYTLDVDVARHAATADGSVGYPSPHVWLRVTRVATGSDGKNPGFTGYAVKIRGTTMYIMKASFNVESSNNFKYTSLCQVNYTVPVGEMTHLKFSAVGNTLTAVLTKKSDGSVLAQKTVEDSTYTCGTIYTHVEYSSAATVNKAEFDNYTVTLNNGVEVFKDDFSDDSVFQGEQQIYTVSKNAPTAADVDFTWTETLQNSSSADTTAEITAGGTYYCVPKNHSWLMANVTAGSSNPMDAMTDYSISVDYVRHNWRSDKNTEGYASPHLLFGMQPIENDATYIWKGYALKLHSGGPYCFQIRIKSNGQIVYDKNLGSQSGGSKMDNWRNVTAGVSGNTITVTLSDLDGNVLSTKTYLGEYAATGVFGLYSEFNKVDDAGTGGYEFDNLKVTQPDGTVFFEETFTLAEGQAKAAYLAATKTFEGVLKTPNWYVSNGVLSGFAAGNANMVVSEVSGTTEYATQWQDYAIDADIMLGSDAAVAGLIANYNAGTYYELRLSAAGVGIYLVTPTDEIQLAYRAMTLNSNQWYLTKLEVDNDGKTLRGYIDSSLEVEATLTDGALAKGTMGVAINGSVKFDNYKAYSVELSDSRIFKTYVFEGEDLTVLDSDWTLSGSWTLADGKLVNQDADAAGLAVLKKKATLDNYNAELRFVAAENAQVEVIGRYDPAAAAGYVLSVHSDNSIHLEKQTAAGTRESLGSVTKQDLYELGIRLIPGKEYTLKLYMHGNKVWGFIDGIRLFAVTDTAYTSGVTAISGTKGAAVVTLTTSEAYDVPKLSIETMQGEAVSGLTAYRGHTPDLKPYRIKAVYYDNNGEQMDEKFADLDAIPMEGTFSTTTSGTVTFFYDYAELVVNYTVDEAVDEIADIKAKIDALNVSALTLADKEAVYALAARYNALSATQKSESFTAAQREKILAAQEAIELLLYPELADDPIVFRDEFDEYVPGKYVNDYLTNGASDPGEWFVENGAMFMYKNRTVKLPTSFTCFNELVKRNFEVKSISVDVQIIDEKAWAGFNFNSKDGKSYKLAITDKSDRVVLNTGDQTITVYANSADLPEADRVTFELGQWYNIRATFEDGLIKCYVNDRLWIEHQDVESIRGGAVNTNGTILLRASENWVKYDNFTVRGKELEWKESEQWYTENDNLPAGSYKDDFNDEAAAENPSHWLELTTTDFWKVMADGENKVYGSTGTKELDSSSWLHVFETDVVYKLKLRVTELGHYPVVGLTARLNADTSYIKAGFDFTLNKWFIKTRYGQDFAEVITYGSAGTFEKDTWYDLKLDVEGTSIKLYCGDTLVAEADAGKKVSPGRVGVFTEQCDVQIDDVDLVLTSGQGRVNDGVMEQYTAQAGAASGTLFNVLPLPDGRYLLNQDGTHYISSDDGMTWEPTTEYKSFKGNSQLILQNGKVINVKYANLDIDGDKVKDDTRFTAYLSEDGGKTWAQVGTWDTLNEKYSQPAEHLSEVVLDDGTHRIFFTNNNQFGTNDGVLNHKFVSNVFYSDDEGATWQRSVNSPAYTANLNGFCESHVLRSKGALPGDPLVHYSTYNSSLTIRYSLSYDGGVTWEGDYAIPDIPCGWNSMTIEQDRETGIYYMATFMQIPSAYDNGFPRLRVVLLSSEDGLNWNFVADVDRWGDVSDADMGLIMQGVNMYLAVDKDYIFVTFSRSEAFSDSGSHNLQVGRLYRFEKAKLDTYDEWPAEYIINPKELLYIEADPLSTYVAEGESFDPTGSKLILHHYDGTTSQIDMTDAFVNQVVGPNGEALVYVDYKYFRSTFTLTAVADEAPVVSGIEDGKTYCSSVTATVTDVDIKSVTLNGEEVTLTDGALTIAPAEGEQILVVTDQLGNVTTVKLTVNDGHTGGTATCTEKAVCAACGEVYGELDAENHTGGTATCKDKAVCTACGEAYGELDAENHTGEAKWSHTDDKHSKAYDCCGKVVVEEEAHKLTDGKCECGYEAPASGDNSQTGDNSHIVLFGSLLALSVLAATVLLIPDIRKKLLNK